jgi:malonate transporter and related proteins
MNHPVLAALLPVVILIAIGFIAGRAGLMPATSVKDLSKRILIAFCGKDQLINLRRH